MTIAGLNAESAFSWAELAARSPEESRLAVGAIGLGLLLFGGRSKRLVSAAPGLILGLIVALIVTQEASPSTQTIAALIGGLVGALMASFLQKLALRIAGVVFGVVLAGAIVPLLPESFTSSIWILVGGGILGALLLPMVVAKTLRFLSPFFAAICFAYALGLEADKQLYAIVGFAIAGFFIQRILEKKADSST